MDGAADFVVRSKSCLSTLNGMAQGNVTIRDSETRFRWRDGEFHLRASGWIPVLLSLICLAAVVTRVAYRVHMGSADFWQHGYSFYYDMAKNILSGKGLWIEGGGWAMRPPIYPYFLSLTAIAGDRYMFVVVPQALFGVGTVICAFLIASELFGNRTGLFAAFLTAFYPYYVVHDTALQETSMVTVSAALSVYLLLRARHQQSFLKWLAAGATLGLTVLIRTTMLPFALMAVAWASMAKPQADKNCCARASSSSHFRSPSALGSSEIIFF